MKIIKNKLFYKNVFSLLIPIALQNGLFILLNMMDTVMLGKIDTGVEEAISAANIGNQPFFLYSLFIFGTVSGAGVLISQYWGRQDAEKINKIAGIALTFCFSIGLLFTAALYVFPGQVISLYSDDKVVIQLATDYLKLVLLSYIPSSVSTLLCGIMRSVEKVRIPLFSSIISVFLNIFFNWVFIFGNLGAPKLGVVGAALGTVIARFCEIVFVLVYIFGVDKTLKLKLSKMFKFDMRLIKDFFSISFPVVMNETLWSLGITTHAAIIGNIGTNAYAAYSVCSVVERVASVLAIGYGNAGAIIIGKALGAGKKEEAFDMSKTLLVLATGTGFVMGLLIFLSRGFISNLLNINDETKNNVMMLLLVLSFMVWAKSYNTLNIVGILRGGGDTKVCLMLDIMPMWFLTIPCGFLAAFYFKLPVQLVYAILASDELIKLIPGSIRFNSKKWIKDIVRT